MVDRSDSSNKAMCGLLRFIFTTYREALQRALRPADNSRDKILEAQQAGGIQLKPRWQEHHTLLMSERLIGLDEDESSSEAGAEGMEALTAVLWPTKVWFGRCFRHFSYFRKPAVIRIINEGVRVMLITPINRDMHCHAGRECYCKTAIRFKSMVKGWHYINRRDFRRMGPHRGQLLRTRREKV